VAGLGPFAFYNLIVVMYLNFATDRLGAAPELVGGIFFLAKIWDAISDPMAGYLSDRTRLRLGRRRSWMLAACIPVAFFSWMTWAPPAGIAGGALVAWIAVSVFGFYTAFTAFDVPHMAYAAELTVDDPAARNRTYAWRQVTRTIAMLLAFGVGTALVADPETGRRGAMWLAVGGGAFTVLAGLFGVRALPPERADFIGRGAHNPWRAVRDVARNRDARLLLFVYFVESIGTGAIGVLVPYVIRYVMKLDTNFIPAMLMVYVFAAFAGIPLWVRLARRFEKRKLWLFAMVQGGLGYGMLFFVGEGDWPLMVVSSLVAGSAGACGNTLGQSLKADLVDVDEYLTGERKEGAYFAAWSFAGKLANGVMVGTVGLVLGALGYVQNQEQSETVKLAMVLLIGGMPLLAYSVGALMFRRFSLGSVEHARIRAELDARSAGGTR
jgi:GPH family glycoside/pentoside/hexuronide:cation symporter